jgi:uroporphyrinogen-III synthase
MSAESGQPLRGWRIIITRPAGRSAAFAAGLVRRGAIPVNLPAIQILPADPLPLDMALQRLAEYDWLVLTSASTVEILAGRLAALGIDRLPEGLKLAAVGPGTAGRAGELGLSVHHVPAVYLAQAIPAGLGDIHSRRILLPQADLADPALGQALRDAGGQVEEIIAYHTRQGPGAEEGLQALRQGVEVITFTSGSTVAGFAALARHVGLDPLKLPGHPRIACIGPKTAGAARQIGFQVDLVAPQHSVEGLIAALEELAALSQVT